MNWEQLNELGEKLQKMTDELLSAVDRLKEQEHLAELSETLNKLYFHTYEAMALIDGGHDLGQW